MDNYLNLSHQSIKSIKYPIITEKATRLIDNNQYSFIVSYNSNKITIKNTIEYLFNVKIIKVNMCRLPRKMKRIGKSSGWKPRYKKAIVTLSKSDVINLFI